MRTLQHGNKTRFIDFALEHLQKARDLWAARPVDKNTSEAEWQAWALQLYDEAVRCVMFSALAIEAEAVVLFRLRGETALWDDSNLRDQFQSLFLKRPDCTWCSWRRDKRPLLERILRELHITFPSAIDTVIQHRNETVHFVGGDLRRLADGNFKLELLDLQSGRCLQFAEKWFNQAKFCFTSAAQAFEIFGNAHARLEQMPTTDRIALFEKLCKEKDDGRVCKEEARGEEQTTDPAPG